MTAKKPKHVVIDVDRYGQERIYYREPGKKKVRLRGPIGEADFWKDYADARNGVLKPRETPVSKTAMPPAGTFNRLCVEYYQSSDFRGLTLDTRSRRRQTLDSIREVAGDLPAAKIQGKHIRKWRDARASQPHSANALVKAFRQLFKFGVEYGHVRTNPAREVSIIRDGSRGYHTWTADELAQYEDFWPTGTQQRLAYDLMLYTGVRRSDACQLGRQHIRDGRLVFTPQKGKTRGGRELSIPIHPNLAESIRATKIGDFTFLITAHGRPWGATGAPDGVRIKHRAASFGNRFKDWCVEAGLPRCTAHGLRKVAVVRLLEAGCTPHEAAAVTGHESMRVLEIYARERNRAALADSAMQKLIGKAGKAEKVQLDDPMANHGTIDTANPLKGLEEWKSLAPLCECVSNVVSGPKGGFSGGFAGGWLLFFQALAYQA